MRNIVVLCLLLHLALNSNGQSSLKTLVADIGPKPQLDAKAQQAINRRDQLAAKPNLSDSESKELATLFEQFDETTESIWDIIGGGCSWYCGGGPYKVQASSNLKESNTITYQAQNAHDLSFESAWVEGAAGRGTGEYVEYFFEPNSPRITEIKIYNGYVKTEQAWKNNARVKQLKVYINNLPFAILALQDTPALQTFVLKNPIGKRKDGKDMILRFEITETYPGEKFEDTAITEIFFDGIDVH